MGTIRAKLSSTASEDMRFLDESHYGKFAEYCQQRHEIAYVNIFKQNYQTLPAKVGDLNQNMVNLGNRLNLW